MDQLPPALADFIAARGLTEEYEKSKDVPRFLRIRSRPISGRNDADTEANEATTLEELQKDLNVPIQRVPWLKTFYSLDASVRISGAAAYKQGLVVGMDAASGLCVQALSLNPDDRVLDLCCAPGTKLGLIADIIGVDGIGHVTGVDFSAKRLGVCRSLLSKLGHSRVRLYVADGRTFNVPSASLAWTRGRSKELPDANCGKESTKESCVEKVYATDTSNGLEPTKDTASPATKAPKRFHANRLLLSSRSTEQTDLNYTKVLIDAECTTDGSFAHLRKLAAWSKDNDAADVNLYGPERPVSVEELPQLQLSLLENGFAMCKPDGIVVYSTCSLTIEQNEDVVAAFLVKHPKDAVLDDIPLHPATPVSERSFAEDYPTVKDMCKVRRFDASTGTSGLFIARFRRLY